MLSSRRDLLRLVTRAAALPGAAEFFSAWLGAAEVHWHATPPPEPPLLREYQPRFFNAPDFQTLEAFCEILIPTDDTPGAREARCAHFIDFLLHSADSEPALQQSWRKALANLKAAGFDAAATPQARAALMETITRPERDRAARHPAYSAYRLIKRLNTFAFYTSRAGLIETLDYRGNTFNLTFPPCDHPEHHTV